MTLYFCSGLWYDSGMENTTATETPTRAADRIAHMAERLTVIRRTVADLSARETMIFQAIQSSEFYAVPLALSEAGYAEIARLNSEILYYGRKAARLQAAIQTEADLIALEGKKAELEFKLKALRNG